MSYMFEFKITKSSVNSRIYDTSFVHSCKYTSEERTMRNVISGSQFRAIFMRGTRDKVGTQKIAQKEKENR